MADTGTVRFMVTYMPISVIVKSDATSLMSESYIIAAIYQKTLVF